MEVEWEQEKDEARRRKMPFITIRGEKKERAMEMCEIQHLHGEYFIWQGDSEEGKRNVSQRMKHICRQPEVVKGSRVWTNSEKAEEWMRERDKQEGHRSGNDKRGGKERRERGGKVRPMHMNATSGR